MQTTFDTSKTSKLQGSNTSSVLTKFQKSWRYNIPVDIHNPNFKNDQILKTAGKRRLVDTRKTQKLEGAILSKF